MRRSLLLLGFFACGGQPTPRATPPSPAATASVATAPPPAPGFGTLDVTDPDAPALAPAMTELARRALRGMGDADGERPLADRALLELTIGDDAAARATIARRRTAVHPADPTRQAVLYMGYELAARARLRLGAGGSFADAFGAELRQVFAPLDDLSAFHASWFLPDAAQTAGAREDLAASLARFDGKRLADPSPEDAAALARSFALYAFAREVAPVAAPLQAEDEARRYEIESDVRIPMHDGAVLSALVVRPRRPAARGALLRHLHRRARRAAGLRQRRARVRRRRRLLARQALRDGDDQPLRERGR